jgi:hypothetical protein
MEKGRERVDEAESVWEDEERLRTKWGMTCGNRG